MSEPDLQVYEGGPLHRQARHGPGPDADMVAHPLAANGSLAYIGEKIAGVAYYRRNHDRPGQWDFVPERSTGPTIGAFRGV